MFHPDDGPAEEAHGHKQRQGDGMAGQQTRQAGSENETQPEGHTDQAEGAGPLLRRGDVRQHGGGRGGGAAAQPVDQAGQEQQGQGQAGGRRARPKTLPGQADAEGEQAQPQYRAGYADRHHRPAAEAIAEGTNQGGGAELGHGIGACQEAEGAAIAAELGQQEGQQRQHQAFSEPVVEQGEKGAQPGGRSSDRHGGHPRQRTTFP